MRESKRAITLILLSFLTSINLLAKDSKPTSETILNIEKFYYQKGYKDAGEKYYRKGYLQAIEDMKKKLLLFKKRHEAIEASKYLSLTGKITYPEVFKIKDGNGGYKIKIIPPRVEKTFSVYDLASLPDGSDINNNMDKEIKSDENKISKAFYGEYDLSNRENEGTVVSATNINKQTTMQVTKNRKNEAVLNIAGVSYTAGKNKYTIYFKDKLEKKIFCNGVGEKLCK